MTEQGISVRQSEVWDSWAKGRPGRARKNAKGAASWFNWTIYPDTGPGVEVLGELDDTRRVLDLGCGAGANLAHVTGLAPESQGVDSSSVQVRKAEERYPEITVWCDDAVRFLETSPAPFHMIYSVYAAGWYINPDDLLPAVLERLAPGGRYAFSQNPPVLPECVGPQGSVFAPAQEGGAPMYLPRWDYPPDEWERRLKTAGFVNVTHQHIPSPCGKKLGTMLITADKPGTLPSLPGVPRR
ncbi:class I SAM-dependent methyltransferase (plasmid) [Streptomyces sp. BI20]|uniref:class I SAM-dependent methyltransferase n=1 Tax=Streptomyces sp. BI20 TaxID=3403460 RepID=UPI003C74B7FB